MDLIDEKDYLPIAVDHFLDDAFQTLLKLSLIFRTRYKCPKIKRIYLAALKVLRNISVDYLLGDTFRYSRLSDSRLSHQYRIVLRSSAENLQHPADLFVTPDHRIELALRRPLIEIDSEPA